MDLFKGIKVKGKDTFCCKTFVLGTHSILQLALFVIFLIFFGIPSVEKYLEKETIVISSEEQTYRIEAPAIALAALRKVRDTMAGNLFRKT